MNECTYQSICRKPIALSFRVLSWLMPTISP
jgi:hypothetical protein